MMSSLFVRHFLGFYIRLPLDDDSSSVNPIFGAGVSCNMMLPTFAVRMCGVVLTTTPTTTWDAHRYFVFFTFFPTVLRFLWARPQFSAAHLLARKPPICFSTGRLRFGCAHIWSRIQICVKRPGEKFRSSDLPCHCNWEWDLYFHACLPLPPVWTSLLHTLLIGLSCSSEPLPGGCQVLYNICILQMLWEALCSGESGA